MIELLFLMGFTLHNIEEAIWLPKWSRHAGKFHHEVRQNEFLFAVIVITALGYLVTFQYFIYRDSFQLSRYIYTGFVLMMTGNVIFPHLLASIVLKKYCPGTITGFLLNLPMGSYIVYNLVNTRDDLVYSLAAFLITTAITLILIRVLFRLGGTMFDNP